MTLEEKMAELDKRLAEIDRLIALPPPENTLLAEMCEIIVATMLKHKDAK